jgi:hypothetical protein
MLDRKESQEQAVQEPIGLEPAGRKVWIKPHLEVADLYETESGNGIPADHTLSISS